MYYLSTATDKFERTQEIVQGSASLIGTECPKVNKREVDQNQLKSRYSRARARARMRRSTKGFTEAEGEKQWAL